MNELLSQGRGEAGRMIASGEVTSTEVVEAHLARIAEVNPTVNAITVHWPTRRGPPPPVDRAVAPAGRSDPWPASRSRQGEHRCGWIRYTWGVAALAGQIAPVDAPPVARLREAGAIPLARTNLPDFAFRWHTESGRAGHTRNPWDPARTPGGSPVAKRSPWRQG